MAEYDIDVVLKNIFDSNESNKWKPSDKIPLIVKELEECKSEMKTFVENSSLDLESLLQETRDMCTNSQALVDEMELCRTEIQDETMAEILNSIQNRNKIAKELQCVNFSLNIVCDIVQCGKYVKEFDDGREAQSFTRAIEAVYDLVQFVDNPVEGYDSLEMHTTTKQTAQLILDNLLLDLFTEWKRLVSWEVNISPQKTVITIILKITDTIPDNDIVNALDKSKKLEEKVSELSQFLLKDVLVPIMHQDCTVFAENDELMTITLHPNVKQKEKPPYDAVIANFRLLFHYLSNKLNVPFNNNNTIMKMLGREICDPFSDVLIKDCLIDTVPNNINELQSYGKITSEIEDFQHFLSLIKFFPDDSVSILRYVNNIDVLFANKSSQYFLETARTIMLKDLSATMSIGVESIPEDSAGDPPIEGGVEALEMIQKTIPKSLFYFPRCMISKAAQELIDLLYVMMEQAVQCSDIVCKKLYYTTRLVFEMYDAVVPCHHEDYLQTIPQYVALFHNNCMFLAHNLQTFGDKWLILMEGRQLDYPIGFVDVVQKLRELGYRHLTVHMQQQRKQILDNIRSSDLNCIAVKDVLSESAESAVRQCLRQLHVLKNVWIGVLPTNVFTRLMATLVGLVAEELVHRVTCAEDVSQQAAQQLADSYSLLLKKAPSLFQKPDDVEVYVKSWVKLQELIFVLGGSLKDIENHWNEGTGPLAIHFRTEEIRNLIKALFQNTQFRANLLSKIK